LPEFIISSNNQINNFSSIAHFWFVGSSVLFNRKEETKKNIENTPIPLKTIILKTERREWSEWKGMAEQPHPSTILWRFFHCEILSLKLNVKRCHPPTDNNTLTQEKKGGQ